MRRFALIAVIVLVGAMPACSTIDSVDLRTSGISAYVEVTADPRGSDVEVVLSAGGLTSVELQGSDRLTATSGDQRVALTHTSFLGSNAYGGRLDGVTRPGAEVTVSLRRGPDDTGAPRSTVRLPGPIAVLAPHPGVVLRRSRDLLVRVNRAPGDYRVSWKGSCLIERRDEDGLTFSEGEPLVVPAGSLAHLPHTPRHCLVTLTVVRTLSGSLDPAYKSGSIVAERRASLAVTSVP